MIGHVSLEEQIEVDFSRARRKALRRQVRTRLRRDGASDGLLCFDEVFKNTFVGAMRPTLILPIAVVMLAAMSCLAIKRRKHKEVVQQHEEAAA